MRHFSSEEHTPTMRLLIWVGVLRNSIQYLASRTHWFWVTVSQLPQKSANVPATCVVVYSGLTTLFLLI